MWQTAGSGRERSLYRSVSAAFLVAYFLFFNLGSLGVHFALDDLSNIGHYYHLSVSSLILSQFTLWHGDFRPMGALFYRVIFHFAGLNPMPYQAVMLAFLLANVYWVYRFAQLLGAGELAAWLAALVVCYHVGLQNLYYNAAFIFDVMCCFFYLAAFTYYVAIRARGVLLSRRQTIVFLLLFVCALNSKEMAVTLPVILLVYEWVYRRPARGGLLDVVAWLRGPGRVLLFAVALTAVDIYGKLFGPEPLSAGPGYHPVFTLDRVRAYQVTSIHDLLLQGNATIGWKEILVFWAVLAAVTLGLKHRRELRLLFWFLLVAPLPIEFLLNKSQACLCLPMVGLAVYAASALAQFCRAAAGLLARVQPLRRLGVEALTVVLALAPAYLWAKENRRVQTAFVTGQMASLGWDNWDIVQQFRATTPPPAVSGFRVVFLAHPMGAGDLEKLAQMWCRDSNALVHFPEQNPLTPDQLARAGAIITFEGRKLIRLR